MKCFAKFRPGSSCAVRREFAVSAPVDEGDGVSGWWVSGLGRRDFALSHIKGDVLPPRFPAVTVSTIGQRFQPGAYSVPSL